MWRNLNLGLSELLSEKDRVKHVVVGGEAEELTWLISEAKPKVLSMLLLEEPNSKATHRRDDIIVWRLTVGSLEDRLGRLVLEDPGTCLGRLVLEDPGT